MVDLKPNDGVQATSRKEGIDKIVICEEAIKRKPIKEFVERMQARGYNVKFIEKDVIIKGDNLEEPLSELENYVDNSPETIKMIIENLRATGYIVETDEKGTITRITRVGG